MYKVSQNKALLDIESLTIIIFFYFFEIFEIYFETFPNDLYQLVLLVCSTKIKVVRTVSMHETNR